MRSCFVKWAETNLDLGPKDANTDKKMQSAYKRMITLKTKLDNGEDGKACDQQMRPFVEQRMKMEKDKEAQKQKTQTGEVDHSMAQDRCEALREQLEDAKLAHKLDR